MTATSPSRTIAVLGLGQMGRPMARNLVDAGFAVRTWNRSGGAVDGATSYREHLNLNVVLSGAVTWCVTSVTNFVIVWANPWTPVRLQR